MGYLLTSMDPKAADGVVTRTETFDDEEWGDLLRLAVAQGAAVPNLILDRNKGEVNISEEKAKQLADALEAALHYPGDAGVLERDTVQRAIRILRRGYGTLGRTPP